MSEILISLNQIRHHEPCSDGWRKLLGQLGKTKPDDEPFPFSVVLASNGLDDTLWALRCLPEFDSLWRHYAVDCAERRKQSMTTDSLRALEVARAYALGQATGGDLSAAKAAASEAASEFASASASAAAWAAAWAAQSAANSAAWAAQSAAQSASKSAAWAAASAAKNAAKNAAQSQSASEAAWEAACAAERNWQSQRLSDLLTEGDWTPLEEGAINE